MNRTSHHSSSHQSGDNCRRIGIASFASPAPNMAPAEELEAELSSLEMLRVRVRITSGNEYSYPSTALSKSTNDADANTDTREGSVMNMQMLRIPTKSENCQPGPILNPASCASGLALIGGGGGGEGDDWISTLSLTTLVERINDSVQDQGNTHRRNSLLQNEDWGELHHPQGQGNLFLGNGGN
mmetsp:Transcript_24258/g.34717  ORF Transcript_24258/g.34717 Transcript_24258/m.34717 type:complete len:184 (+) Transcript_24258:49-600(+)|eukprot:CAMPEP_0201689810 /NCGR_PEP_ID=MMETSP0578-20130828/3352_1 /ASSEMBLY_ACC=CAM_ASM_000663 /TAXON_ID=267565 /ORGANISM="Skeletonema grethea, Strain CCMP 1804" /LENGTH=183 /DNA_ID=CAMNT_0048174581 /DNA_START=25 /DNA_END=576 /DNA_ORIENTATION=-